MISGYGMDLIKGEAVSVLKIRLDAAEKAFCDALAAFRFFQPLLVGRIGNKGDFSKYRRHIRPDKHHEGCLADSSATVAMIEILHALGERILDTAGEIAGFLNFFVSRDLLQYVLKIMHRVL